MKNAEKPLLKRVYDILLFNEIVSNAADFASQLGYNAGHISTLMKQKEVLPMKVIEALSKTLNNEFEKFGGL
jgi:hypothetical protein